MSGALLCALYKCNNNIFHIIPQHSICNCKYDFIFIGTSKNFRTRIIKFFNELFQKQSLFHCNAQRHQGILMLCRQSPKKLILCKKKHKMIQLFLDGLTSLGSMLGSDSVIHVFEILSNLGHIFRLSSVYAQGMFRLGSG